MITDTDSAVMRVVRSTSVCAAFVVFVSFFVFASSAFAHRGRVFGPSFGMPGSGAGQLSLTYFRNSSTNHNVFGGSGIAVDEASHDVYVADTGNHRVDEFTAGGAFVRAWGWGVIDGAPGLEVCTSISGCRAGLSGNAAGELEAPAFVAVDNTSTGKGDVYVADYQDDNFQEGASNDRIVQKFTPEGGLIESWGTKGQVAEGSLPAGKELGAIRGVAVAPSGELLVSATEGIFGFDQSSGAVIDEIKGYTTTFPNGFAIDGLGNMYTQYGANILKLNPGATEATSFFQLVALPPPGLGISIATGFAVARSGELFVDEGSAVQVVSSACVSSCSPLTTFTSPRLTGGAGLAVDSQSGVVYIAETVSGEIESIVPEPPAAPLVLSGSESVSDVSADGATMEAVVSPRSVAGEEPTVYRFEYTTDERFQREGFTGANSVPVPAGRLAASFEDERVIGHAQGLESNTVYHYRVVAENAISRREGKPTEGEANGAGEEVARTFVTQTPGVFGLLDGRVWELVSPPDKRGALLDPRGAQAAADGGGIVYLASAPTESQPAGNANLTTVLSTRGMGGVAGWGSRDISVPHDIASGGLLGLEDFAFFSSDLSLSVVDSYGAFNPSLSVEASEQTAYVRSDFVGGDPTVPCVSGCYRPLVTGAPGFANVPEETKFGTVQNRSGEPCHVGVNFCGPSFAFATADGSHVVLTSEVPLVEGATSNGLYEWSAGRLQLVSVSPKDLPVPGNPPGRVAKNAVSSDGSRVVWKSDNTLYLRDMVREETVQLGAVHARFQRASSDGSRVLYTSEGDLYLFEAGLGSALNTGHTTDLTPGGEVVGYLPGASEDGSYVYFVAHGDLSGSETNLHGETAIAGQKLAYANLYAYHEGTTRLVAVLSEKDDRDWDVDNGEGPLTELTARASPDGRWLAFMSERPLTGYDNRDAASGERDEEVFLYHADDEGGKGGLVCASCDPTGARPHGVFNPGTIAEHLLVDSAFTWADRWLAGNIPGWGLIGGNGGSAIYQSRYLSDSGRLFFDSADALVSSDTNGGEDVYEYEPPGVGGCVVLDVTYVPGSGGCVDLVSSGVSSAESAFLDASESGDDVFFLTSAQLVGADSDSSVDVYDARVGGGVPVASLPPACEGDACQSPVAPPVDPTPGSLTYRGPGNPTSLLAATSVKKKTAKCVKGKRVHGRCVAHKKKRKARRSVGVKNERRAGR